MTNNTAAIVAIAVEDLRNMGGTPWLEESIIAHSLSTIQAVSRDNYPFRWINADRDNATS